MKASEFGVREMDAQAMREVEGGSLLWDLAKAAGRALMAELERMARPTV